MPSAADLANKSPCQPFSASVMQHTSSHGRTSKYLTLLSLLPNCILPIATPNSPITWHKFCILFAWQA